MKNTIVNIFIFGFIGVVMFLNNPGIEDHRTAVFEKVKEKVNQSVSDVVAGNEWGERGKNMGLSILKAVIDNIIVRDDYGIFSITRVPYPSEKRIGIGVLGHVFIFTDFDPSKDKASSLQNEIEETEAGLESREGSESMAVDTPTTVEPDNLQYTPDYPIGDYIAGPSDGGRIYFYNQPYEGTRRKAFLVEGDQVYVERVENGFGYVVFTNSWGQVSKGWVRMDLLQDANGGD